MNINLSVEQAEVVREILEQGHRELLLEIARSEHHEFTVALRHREQLLKSILEKLGSFQPVR